MSAGLIVIVTLSPVSDFATMPIATAIAIFFVVLLLPTLLAGPFLGAARGLRRSMAIGAGLRSALIVIRPNFIESGASLIAAGLVVLAHHGGTPGPATIASRYSVSLAPRR